MREDNQDKINQTIVEAHCILVAVGEQLRDLLERTPPDKPLTNDHIDAFYGVNFIIDAAANSLKEARDLI